MNTVNIANIVDFNAMKYKKQYNVSPQILVTYQTGNSIERHNFTGLYLFYTYRLGSRSVVENT